MFTKDDIISSYTADQAIEDGILADMSELGKEAGFKWPVRFSQNVVELCTPPKSNKYESFKGRAWDVLFMARLAIKGAKDDHMTTFRVKIGKRIHTLWAMLDGTSGPAIHIITPEEN